MGTQYRSFRLFQIFVTCYNSSIGSVSPIYLKHTRVHKDDEMLGTINMNNWNEFLDSSIRLALSMSDYKSATNGSLTLVKNLGQSLESTRTN